MACNFAAGAFLVILRPFKVGDYIGAGGVMGTVEEIGLFVTTINTPDNLRTYVCNNKTLSDNIQDFTANPCRRVDITPQVAHNVDPRQAMERIAAGLSNILFEHGFENRICHRLVRADERENRGANSRSLSVSIKADRAAGCCRRLG